MSLLSSLSRIDVHHHYFPPGALALSDATNTWPAITTDWTANDSIVSMDYLGTEKAILSFPVALPSAHALNLQMYDVVQEYPDRFGFFASLPLGYESMDEVLTEVDYALDTLNADGILLMSAFYIDLEELYLGNSYFDPLWAALDARNATVFIHGIETDSDTLPSELMRGPVAVTPGATYKTAADMVTSGTKAAYPNVNIILSHCGGSTPFLVSRVAVLTNYVGIAKDIATMSVDDIIAGFKTFYYESALSGYNLTLLLMENFIDQSHLLFGTDYPAVSTSMASYFTENVDAYFGIDSSYWTSMMSGNWATIQGE